MAGEALLSWTKPLHPSGAACVSIPSVLRGIPPEIVVRGGEGDWCWDTARSHSTVPQIRQQLALLMFWGQMLSRLSGTDHESQLYSGFWFLDEIFMAKV